MFCMFSLNRTSLTLLNIGLKYLTSTFMNDPSSILHLKETKIGQMGFDVL